MCIHRERTEMLGYSGMRNDPKTDKRGRQKIPYQRIMSALKGFAKTGGSVNRVISRNGG